MQLCGDISVQGRTFQEKNVYTGHKWFFIPSYAQTVIEMPQQGLLFLMMCLLRDRLTNKVKDRHLFWMLGEGEDRFFVFLSPFIISHKYFGFLYCGATNLPTHHLSFIKPEGQVCDKSEVLYNFHFLKNKFISDE